MSVSAPASDDPDGDDAVAALVREKTAEIERERARLHEVLEVLKQAQTQLLHSQKLESIGQLAAGIAHEINTPIQYISDNVMFLRQAFSHLIDVLEVAERDVADEGAFESQVALREALQSAQIDFLREQVPQALEQTVEGLQRVIIIVSAMKRLSHSSNGAVTEVDLHELVQTATVIARNEWKYVAELTVTAEPDLPPVWCNRDDLSGVMLNLIINAAQAIAEAKAAHPAHPGQIDIHLAMVDDRFQITVQDTGTGIPAAIHNRVFDPFFTTKPVGQGTGQGLAIAHAVVVDRHHGAIRFETEPGVGTTFIVQLPLRPPGTSHHAPAVRG